MRHSNLGHFHTRRSSLCHSQFRLFAPLRLLLPFALAVLMVGTVVSAFAQKRAYETRLALVIGNASYPDAERPLKEPINDARALTDELKRNGFEVDVGENLTKEAMQRALTRLYDKIKPNSVALLFFSGYGIQAGRQSYLIPVNAQIWTEPEVARDGINLDKIVSEMNTRGARVKIAILDASRRNPFERRFRSLSSGLAPVDAPKGTVVMYSAAPSTVIGDAGSDKSIFVSELLKEIRKPGLIDEAFNRTKMAVSRATKYEQVPWFSSSLVEEFSFTERKEVTVHERDRPTEKGPVKPSVSSCDDDVSGRRDFDFAKKLDNRRAWQDFLDEHPTGCWAERARSEIVRLEGGTKGGGKTTTTTPPPTTTTALDPESLMRRGRQFVRDGNYRSAARDFDEVLRQRPDDTQTLNDRCWTRAIMGELRLALHDCNEALRLKPNFVDALDSRGFVHLKLGEERKAIADYDAALRINPRQASSLYGRGIARRHEGNVRAAERDIANARTIQPDIAEEFERYGVR